MLSACRVWVLVACGLAASAQSWEPVRALTPGERVQVQELDGRRVTGPLISVSADAIVLRSNGSEVSVERARVRKVKVRSTERRVRNAVIGAAIGVAVGLTVDQTLGTYLRNESSGGNRPMMYLAPIAIVGGIAALLPAYRTVYAR